MADLAPYPTPMGMFPAFIAQRPETLVIKEKVMSLSGDSFDIKLADGRPIFQVQGNAWSLSGRKRVMDMAGNHLFTIRKKHLAFHTTFYAEDPNENQILEVKSQFSSKHLLSPPSRPLSQLLLLSALAADTDNPAVGSSKAHCNFASSSGKAEQLLMKGDFFDRSADITDSVTKQPVAIIRRQFFNARELIAGQQTYEVAVAPNVDMAIIAAMCICLDEKRNESKN